MSQNHFYPHVLDTVEADSVTKVAHSYQRAEGVPIAPLLIDAEGKITSPKLPELQARLDELEEKLAEAKPQQIEAHQKVADRGQYLQRLEREIGQGSADAAARHSSAAAGMTALERDAHNLDLVVTSLEGQRQAVATELDFHQKLSGKQDLITAGQRAQELAEAKAEIRAIVEPLIRRHR